MANLGPTDDYTFAGNVRFRVPPKFPDASIPSASILGPIAGDKVQGNLNITLSQTGTVVAATQYLRAIFGTTGLVVALKAAIVETIATGADRTVTIDLLKSTGAGAFASILTAPLVLNNASTLRTLTNATFSAAGLVAGDILKLTVAVAGAAGAQALGLVVSVTLREDPS